MVKKNLKWAMASMFAIALGLSFSSFTDEGEAVEYKAMEARCPDGRSILIVCAVGTGTCHHESSCPD